MRHNDYQQRCIRKAMKPGYLFRTAEYDKFQIIYVLTGCLCFETQGLCSELTGGSIAVLRQGSAFRLSCSGDGYEGVGYAAVGELPAEFEGASERLEATDNIALLAGRINYLLEQAPPFSSQELPGLGSALAWESLRLSRNVGAVATRGRTGVELAETALTLLDSHLYTSTSIRDLLSVLPISYRHLCRHFKEHYGMSPKRYQLRRKTEEAKRMLEESPVNITTIAMELGYYSSQHFATQFKDATGVSPSEWRTRGE